MGASRKHPSPRPHGGDTAGTSYSTTGTATDSRRDFSIMTIVARRSWRGRDGCGGTPGGGRGASHVLFVVQNGTPGEEEHRPLLRSDVVVRHHRRRIVDVGTNSAVSGILFDDIRGRDMMLGRTVLIGGRFATRTVIVS